MPSIGDIQIICDTLGTRFQKVHHNICVAFLSSGFNALGSKNSCLRAKLNLKKHFFLKIKCIGRRVGDHRSAKKKCHLFFECSHTSVRRFDLTYLFLYHWADLDN